MKEQIKSEQIDWNTVPFEEIVERFELKQETIVLENGRVTG